MGWSGVAYVVLTGAREAVDDRSVAQALDGAAIGCLVVFLGALRAALRRREGGVVPVLAFVLFLGWIAAMSVALTRAR